MLDTRLRVFLVIGILLFTFFLVNALLKDLLSLRYSLLWLFAVLVMLFSVMFPEVIYSIGRLIGIKTPSNFIFALFMLFSLLIILSLSVIVTHLNNRIFRLTQNQALLEKKIRDLEKTFTSTNNNINRDDAYE